MLKKIRIFLEDTPCHVLLKALDNVELFKDDADIEYFYNESLVLSKMYKIDIHAYTLMPDFFEYLATPQHTESIPKFMQSLGRKYTEYYNKKYSRRGTLWQGRYKNSLVEANLYLFKVMFYIESMPKTFNEKPFFSSYARNRNNRQDLLVTPHKFYKALGYTDKERLEAYKLLQKQTVLDSDSIAFIEKSLQKQTLTGSQYFATELEKLTGVVLTPKKRGRPRKKTKGKNMYKNLVLLDKTKHKEIRLKELNDLTHAKNMSFIPIVASEVSAVAQSFPVVFTTQNTKSLIALTSLGSDCLAINEQGKWIAPYMPLHLRKYPFAIVAPKEDPTQRVILIDEDAPNISTKDGSLLFNEDGTQAPLLQNATKLLEGFAKDEQVTLNVINEIMASGILEDKEISVGEGEEKKVLVSGFQVVNREKLYALSDDILANWARKGIVGMIENHLNSLAKVQNLFQLATQKQQ